MVRKRFFGRRSLALASGAAFVGAALVAIQACGTANDQGIAFRAFGFFADSSGETGDLGRSIFLSCTTGENVAIGLENNMAQGINVQRIDVSYNIPGSGVQLSPIGEPSSQRLGPSSGQEQNPSRSFSEFTMLNGAQIASLNQNRSRLPPFPFQILVTASGVGVADSGDFFATNPLIYEIDVFDTDTCPTEEEETT